LKTTSNVIVPDCPANKITLSGLMRVSVNGAMRLINSVPPRENPPAEPVIPTSPSPAVAPGSGVNVIVDPPELEPALITSGFGENDAPTPPPEAPSETVWPVSTVLSTCTEAVCSNPSSTGTGFPEVSPPPGKLNVSWATVTGIVGPGRTLLPLVTVVSTLTVPAG
jgi:hypothetical protein